MDAIEASQLLGSATFVDVREAYEYAAGHVAGAIHIPIGQIKQRFEEMHRELPVIVTCQIGQRSALVASFLSQNGFEVNNLEGGLEAWTAAGLPLEASGADGGRVVDGWARDLDGKRLSPAPEG